jgi:hypothetical protein
MTDIQATSLTVADFVAALFEIVHPLVEIVSDSGPAVLNDENQDWDRDRADDQNGLETDGAALVVVELFDEFADCGQMGHVDSPG